MRLKILSYNIHKGFDWNNKNYYLQKMKDLIQSTDAEIVFLQEVVGQNDHYQKNGHLASQFEFLADQVWPHFSYAKNSLYDHGHHGNLILSKYPIESFENVNISTNSWEKRGLLVCKIKLPINKSDLTEKIIVAACIHLNLLHSGRKIQYETIKNHLTTLTDELAPPLIVAGDFNDWNQQSSKVFEDVLHMRETHKLMHGKYAKTFPVQLPFLCLDRIYVKDIKVISSSVVNNNLNLSDHLPIFCEVEI
jgi:endonuclease/exonuclease/phosphatase family metal-dependent hydrolase